MVEDIRPPIVRKAPKETKIHGDILVDDYFWIRDRSNPGVIEYVEAENRYTERVMKHTEPLQARLFDEFKKRIVETDSTVPEKIDDYFYYTRTEKGKQHDIHCRKKHSLESDEDIILDVNELAAGNEFFNMDVHQVSPDHKYLAYLADMDGSERHALFIKDLITGSLLPETMKSTSSVVWADSSKVLFYSIMDQEFRAFKVFRHVLGTDPKEDVEVFHEPDHSYYYLILSKTKSKAFITITVESATTSEVRYIHADQPNDSFKVLKPRKHMIFYFMRHPGDKFYIMTNEDARNFKVMEVRVADPSLENWTEFWPQNKDISLDFSDPFAYFDVFKNYMVLFEHKDCIGRIRIVDLKTKDSHIIELPEELRTVTPMENPGFDSDALRFGYSSFVTPNTVYEYHMKARKLELRKQDKIAGHDPSKYVTERIRTKAEDGAQVPISLVYRKGLQKNGKNPCYLYAYGAYGDFEGSSPKFNPYWLSLLDRGFVCATAHIRGGGDLGRAWHEQGRVLTKRNTFTDFITCAQHLINEGYTSTNLLAIRGKSAGGLLMGSVATMRPDLFRVVVAEVPFVDAINTMLDDTIPMTAGEFEEWGNPEKPEEYRYIRSYSPYDNIKATSYPNLLITSAWNDSRVQYWEPTKFAAKMRAMKTDSSLLLLKTDIIQGHSGPSGRYDALKHQAFIYSFILDRLDIRE